MEGAPGATDFWGTTASQLQTGLTVNETTKKITGTLNYIATGQIVTDWNNHNFMGLYISSTDDRVAYFKAGIKNLVKLDEDGLILVSVEDKTKPLRVVTVYENGQEVETDYDISGLTLADA